MSVQAPRASGRRPALGFAVVLLCLGAGCGDDPGEDPLWPVRKEGRLVPRSYDLPTSPVVARDQPAVVRRSTGTPWVAHVAWDGGADRIELRSLPDWDTSEPVVAYTSPTRVLGLAAACDAEDRIHLVWSEQHADGWALRHLLVAPAATAEGLGALGTPTDLLVEGRAHLLAPVLVADPDGHLLLVWQQLDRDGMTLRAASLDADGAGPPVDVSVGHSAWAPAATPIAPRRFAVAWDTADGGDYDVAVAWITLAEDGRATVEQRAAVTDSPRFEAGPSLAADGERLYLAYEVAGEAWGREGSYNRLEEALHSERTIEIVAIEDGLVAPLLDPPTAGMKPALADSCEQPRLMVDGGGNLLLFFRGLPLPAAADDPMAESFADVMGSSSGGKGWRTSIWYSYWTRYDGRRWSAGDRHHAGLTGSEGRCDASLGLTRLRGGGAGYAVVGDGRVLEDTLTETGLSWWRPISGSETAVTPGRIARGAPRQVPIALGPGRRLGELEPGAARLPHARREARSLPDGRRLHLALGDLHRHTDLSRCSSNWDGPFLDAMRYAFDVAPLDFLALTDHFEHMTAYDWWRSLAWVEAHQIDGRMVNLRAYERADAWTGHRNVIAADDALPVVGYRQSFEPTRDDGRAAAPEDLWDAFASARVLSIPHTPAGMFAGSGIVFDWSQFEPRYDRLVEVWQGYRGSSEAAQAPRAMRGMPPRRYVLPQLERGLHFGLVAGSDHQSAFGSYVGTWCAELTRESVFEALHARRTFASTVPLSLWATWAGHPLGARAAHAAGPEPFELTLQADGLWLERLDLIVDGLVTRAGAADGTGSAADFGMSLALDVPADGERVVYARLLLRTGETRRPARVEAVVDGSVVADVAFEQEATGLTAALQLPGALGDVSARVRFAPATGVIRLESPERDAQVTLGVGAETAELPWAPPPGARNAWLRVVFEDLELAWTSPIRLGPKLVEGDGPDGAAVPSARPLLGGAGETHASDR